MIFDQINEVEAPKRWTPEAGWTTIIAIGIMCIAILGVYVIIGYALKGSL